MSLSVLQVAYPFVPISSDAVGGAEQVLRLLDAHLVEGGHRSLVLACSASRVAGELIPGIPLAAAASLDDRALLAGRRAVNAELERVLEARRVDVVHLHGIDFAAYEPRGPQPRAVTLHLPPSWYPREVFGERRPLVEYVCVSLSQRAACPPTTIPITTIENGVRLDELNYEEQKRGPALVLGRVCPEKGLHVAVEAARRASLPLILGGQLFAYAAHAAYWQQVLSPSLDEERRFIGPVGLAAKRELLASARCLVVPSLVDETSSLVAMEALASGTPVVACRRGALPEIVEDGVTGFIVDGVDEMATAMRDASRLSPAACRRAALRRFDARRMARQYLDLYERLASGAPSRGAKPRGRRAHTVEVVEGPEAHVALAFDWAELWNRCPTGTVFQRPEWLLPWAQAFAPERLVSVAVRRGGQLAALAPLCTPAGDHPKVLKLQGVGVSDLLDVLVDPREPDATATLLGALPRLCGGGGYLELTNVPSHSPLLTAERALLTDEPSPLTAQRSPETVWTVAPDEVCPRLSLVGGLTQALPRAFYRRLRSDQRRATRARLHLRAALDVAEARAFLQALFELHARRWRTRGEEGVLADPAVQAFHGAVLSQLFPTGTVSAIALLQEEVVVGVYYGFLERGRAELYLTGFEPRLHAMSPGVLLLGAALEAAVAAGAHEASFLRGRESYKYDWGAVDEQTWRLSSNRR